MASVTVKLIAGLGNPGKEYAQTRHNIGFLAVETLATKLGEQKNWKTWNAAADICEPAGFRLLKIIKPLLYMNNSGSAVREVASYYGISPQEILVVADDFSLPLGTIRLRLSGSSGGHNGLQSIIEDLETSQFSRLRLGIGPVPKDDDPADYVLSKFKKSEHNDVSIMLDKATETMQNILNVGLERAVSGAGGNIVV